MILRSKVVHVQGRVKGRWSQQKLTQQPFPPVFSHFQISMVESDTVKMADGGDIMETMFIFIYTVCVHYMMI